jgi:uncharacterized protein YjiS (DUF1127 family)
MNTQAHCPSVTVPRPPSSILADVVNALHEIAQAAGSWFAARQRISDDHDALARMSDRELFDIGLDRASVDYAAHGGRVRDYPF